MKSAHAGHRFVVPLVGMLFAAAVTAGSGAGCSARGADDAITGDLPLKHIEDVPLPGRASRFDYESYDAGRHPLFIAHLGDSEVVVFDTLASRVVARIPGISAVHGVLVVPELFRVYASATGTNEVVAIDAGTHRSYFPLKDVNGHPVLRIMAPR